MANREGEAPPSVAIKTSTADESAAAAAAAAAALPGSKMPKRPSPIRGRRRRNRDGCKSSNISNSSNDNTRPIRRTKSGDQIRQRQKRDGSKSSNSSNDKTISPIHRTTSGDQIRRRRKRDGSKSSNSSNDNTSPIRRTKSGDQMLVQPRRKSTSRSPVRNMSVGSLRLSSSSRSPNRSAPNRPRSFSPFRLLQQGQSGNGGPSALHIVPEVKNESCNSDVSSSVAFKREQMTQAFGALTTLDEANRLPSYYDDNYGNNSGTSDIALPDGLHGMVNEDDEHDVCNSDVNEDVSLTESAGKRNSLERLGELPEYFGNPAGGSPGDGTPFLSESTSNSRASRRSSHTRHSATSSTIASGVSRLSFTSLTSFGGSVGSMPSLSSIFEHDLSSVAGTSVAGCMSVASDTSSKMQSSFDAGSIVSTPSSTHPSSRGVKVNPRIVPILWDPAFAPSTGSISRSSLAATVRIAVTSSTSSTSSSATKNGKTTGMTTTTPAATAKTTMTPTTTKELEHLEGTTLECLRPTVPNKFKPQNQRRWESDTVMKMAGVAHADPGNPNLAPLTHTQKMLLPPRQDVQPIFVARRRDSYDVLPNMGRLAEHSPAPVVKDKVPSMARRMSSNGILDNPPSPIGGGSPEKSTTLSAVFIDRHGSEAALVGSNGNDSSTLTNNSSSGGFATDGGNNLYNASMETMPAPRLPL